MAFDAQKFKKKAKMELSTRNGGNLRKKVNKIPQEQISIFIGLGGLGCKAVNAIKGTAQQKLDNPDRRFFLAIDTDTASMNNISESTAEDLTSDAQHGWMTEDEKCSLFNEMNSYTVGSLPHDIDDWVNRADSVVISGQGAHAVRQVGRIMLFSKGNYEAVYGKISDMVQKAVAQRNALPGNLQNGKIKVYIVAGISGGTGSGTVVDISFMVRKILNQYTMASFNVEGVLFTPDVQENDKGMRPADRLKNKRNFYAAIKEIDYFYNNRTRKKIYSCPKKENANDQAYEYDIFDGCTIISRFSNGTVIAETSAGVIDKAANAIVYEVSSVKAANTGAANEPLMPLSSYMDNEPALVSAWLSTDDGQDMHIPEWAPPRYSTLGYGSFYVPRDELLAYCANKLMKKLMETWDRNILDSRAAQQFMAKYGVGSLRGFAGKLFEYAEATPFFDIPHKDMPRDPVGLLKVQNCCFYLEEMKNIAIDEGQEVKVKQLIRNAAMKTDGGIVTPLCTHFDKAFLDEIPNTGPAYAVRLLSSIDPSNPGILANLRMMLNHIDDEVEAWEAELQTTFNSLYKLGEELEGKSAADKNELEEFTAQCRDYGEKLLQAKMLRYSYEVLYDVYSKLNAKNSELFNIYTVALEYLVDMLQGDSDYVTNPRRCREGNSTVFSFDIVNFEDGDTTTAKFMQLFDGLVDNMDVAKRAKDFVDDVFKEIKIRLETAKTTEKQFTEDDVLDVIRDYFSNTFGLWTNDVIERFCIIAYSQLDIKPEELTEIWYDETKADARNTALANTAQTIRLQLSNTAGVLLSSSDSTKDIEKFNGYTALLGIHETKNINHHIPQISEIDSSWSEFVLFKRRGGIPLCFIEGFEDCQKIYSTSTNSGLHLDEVGDNWKVEIPEPYGYNIRNYMGKYEKSGSDQVEDDKKRMSKILQLAKEAKELGLLKLSQNADDGGGNVSVFYNMYYDFVAPLDIDAAKTEIAGKFKATIQKNIAEEKAYDMLSCLVDSGYQIKAPVEIRWTYAHPELNGLMKDCTSFGDDINFGNFVTLIRSNFEWYKKLLEAVETFKKLNAIYQDVLAVIEEETIFQKGLTTLVDAIKVNRFAPFYINNTVSGFEIKSDTDSTKYIRFLNDGFKTMDNYFLIYLAYVECFMKLSGSARKTLDDLMAVDFSIDKHTDWNKASRSNVDWFIEAADKVLNDTEMLNYISESLLEEKIESLLKYSNFKYSLPEASDDNKNVSVVIKNLRYFYRELRDVLTSNRIADSIPFNDGSSDSGSTQATATWICSTCGKVYDKNVKFCPEDGTKQPPEKQPENKDTWICPACGKVNEDSVNFCPIDGTKKPEKKIGNSDTWVCPVCSRVNEDSVKFCPADGTKRPEKQLGNTDTWVCPVCGRVNENSVNFCPADGAKKPQSTWFCPSCGKENPADVNFCPVDGTRKA